MFPYVADYLRPGLPAGFQSALTTRPKFTLRNLLAGLGNAAFYKDLKISFIRIIKQINENIREWEWLAKAIVYFIDPA